MKREIQKKLCLWQASTKRKPLILMGARQVGKTTSLLDFAKSNYENYVYVNFEQNKKICELFEQSLDSKAIIKALEIEFEQDISSNNSLIIFDEIQECPNALNSLKYFCEQSPQIHICAAGSLLGVHLSKHKGFPVGKVDFHNLYPMSFSEFLQAVADERLVAYLQNEISIETVIPENIHKKLIAYFKSYLLVGGMPEAVAIYKESEDYAKAREIHKNILTAYSLDFAKHAAPEIIMKINQVWQSIPTQLAKENKKFIYSVIRKGTRAKYFEDAIQWLQEAGLVQKVFNITVPKLPIKAYTNFDSFKLYLSDVGLLSTMVEVPIKSILNTNNLFAEFKGSLVENFAAQALTVQGYSLTYWSQNNRSELDFIIQHEDQVIPIEIKSGNSDKKKSLKIYQKKYSPKLSIRCSPNNLKLQDSLLNCPLYLTEQISSLIS